MGAIAQVLEILRHQSEVGVKASGFLIIYNKVLKSIDIGYRYIYLANSKSSSQTLSHLTISIEHLT